MCARASVRTLRWVTLLLTGAAITGVDAEEGSAQADPTDTDYATWYEGLRESRPDPTRGALVEDVVLERDVGSFHLQSGTLHLLEPIAGRTVGAVFLGTGQFTMYAPIPVEQRQLLRVFDQSPVAIPFRTAVLLFTDITSIELEELIPWESLEPSNDARREIEEALDYVSDDDGWIARSLMVPMLNQGPGFFRAHFAQDRGDPSIFQINPYAFEEVSLSRRADGGGKRPEVVTQFHRSMDYETGSSVPQEALDLVRISQYDIETEIDDDLDLVGRSTLTLRPLAAGHRWVPFRLHPELEIDSIHLADGSPVPYHRPRESSDLWLDVSGLSSEANDLVLHYHGDIMERPQDMWVQMSTSTTWFPVYEFGRPTPYRLSFNVPDEYTVSTVGNKLEETTTDGRTRTVWTTDAVREMTFNLGEFDEYTETGLGGQGLTVLINERAHRRLGGLLSSAGYLLFTQGDMAETVARDLGASFAIYGEWYGPTPVGDFVASEIPYTHGQAFPGLVLLAWNTFQYTVDGGFDEMFRAHEVAHQWWGIGVRPATYRDWWLAEGFSEFSGLWYAARARGSMDLYYRRLEQTREAILERRGDAAPIALGTRAGSSEHPGDYQLTVYQKSAWVLHMLRTLLTDPDTGNDEVFLEVMRTFYEDRVGRTATTARFQQIVEDVVGASMDWFFEQWVNDSAIPTYFFSHAFEDQPDGSVKMTVRVRQENVPEDFQMIVPVYLDFGVDGDATIRIHVSGPETVVEMPLLPREPDDIVFNPFEAVLAETRTEGWRGG